MNYDAEIVIGCLCVVVGVAAVVNRLRPAQQLVVLAGAIALIAQAVYAPCVYPDGSTARTWATHLTYFQGGMEPWVDVGRQTIWFSAIIAGVVIACVVLEWRHRVKQKQS